MRIHGNNTIGQQLVHHDAKEGFSQDLKELFNALPHVAKDNILVR